MVSRTEASTFMNVMESPSLLSFPDGLVMRMNPFASMDPVSVVTFPDASTRVSPSRLITLFVMFSSSTHSSKPVLGEGRSSETMRSPGEMSVGGLSVIPCSEVGMSVSWSGSVVTTLVVLDSYVVFVASMVLVEDSEAVGDT